LESTQMLEETKWWTFICKKHVKNKFFTSPRQGKATTILLIKINMRAVCTKAGQKLKEKTLISI
jgi:hypothetical protein